MIAKRFFLRKYGPVAQYPEKHLLVCREDVFPICTTCEIVGKTWENFLWRPQVLWALVPCWRQKSLKKIAKRDYKGYNLSTAICDGSGHWSLLSGLKFPAGVRSGAGPRWLFPALFVQVKWRNRWGSCDKLPLPSLSPSSTLSPLFSCLANNCTIWGLLIDRSEPADSATDLQSPNCPVWADLFRWPGWTLW